MVLKHYVAIASLLLLVSATSAKQVRWADHEGKPLENVKVFDKDQHDTPKIPPVPIAKPVVVPVLKPSKAPSMPVPQLQQLHIPKRTQSAPMVIPGRRQSSMDTGMDALFGQTGGGMAQQPGSYMEMVPNLIKSPSMK